MISIDINDTPDENWNSRLLNSKFGTIFHSKEFASYTENALDWQSNYLKFINEKGSIIGQVLLSQYYRFKTKGHLGKIIKIIPSIKKSVYRWNYGPIIFDSQYKDQIISVFCDFLLSKKCMIFGSEHPLEPRIFSRVTKPFNIISWNTFLIDLSHELDDIWEKMDKHSARKNVERSEKKGVYVKEIKKSDLFHIHKLREDKINQKPLVDLSVLELHWDKLRPAGWTGFLAFENEIPVGSIMTSFFNGYINESGIARSGRDLDAKLYAQDLLKWKIIEWGVKNKYRFYDLTGANPKLKNEKEKGIFRYKKKWGGDLVKYNLIEL